MKILLINNNPVVSRLTALSARKEEIDIDEIKNIGDLSSQKYDIVFVDADSWSSEVDTLLSGKLNVEKRVLFYAQDDIDDKSAYDITILKPFLPSEVSAVIRNVEESKMESERTPTPPPTSIDAPIELNLNESKKDELLPLDLDMDEKKPEIELTEKVTLVESDKEISFDEKLEEAFPLNIEGMDDELFIKDESKETLLSTSIEKIDKEEDLFKLELNDDKLTLEDDLFEKDTTDGDDLLDFDFDKSDEISFEDLNLVKSITDEKSIEEKKVTTEVQKVVEDEPKEVVEKELKIEELNIDTLETVKDKPKEELKREIEVEVETMSDKTKILDENEITTIKNILDNKDESVKELSEVMSRPEKVVTTLLSSEFDEKVKVEKKKEKKSKDSLSSSSLLIEALSSMPIENLRELLAGAKVNVSIKFPKVK